MPLPLLFIGIAAATGVTGAGGLAKAGIQGTKARSLNKDANEMMKEAAENLDLQRKACGTSLEKRNDSNGIFTQVSKIVKRNLAAGTTKCSGA